MFFANPTIGNAPRGDTDGFWRETGSICSFCAAPSRIDTGLGMIELSGATAQRKLSKALQVTWVRLNCSQLGA